jgi:hypothetical protein
MPNIGGADTRMRETIGWTQILIRKAIEQATSGRCDARLEKLASQGRVEKS